jgi:hypothetical protein
MRCSAKQKILLTLIGLVACASFAALVPASAATKPALSIPYPCSDPQPCFNITNYGTGSALQGLAPQNSGLIGITKKFLSTDPGSKAGIGGVLGLDLSKPPTQSAEDFTAGVFGLSNSGEGALDVSVNKVGTVGVTFFPSAKSSSGGWPGIAGIDASTDNGTNNAGVQGTSTAGAGVVGVVFPNFAVNPSPVGVFGAAFSADGDPQNIGVESLAYGTGVLAESLASAAPAGSVQSPALQVVCDNGTPAIIASTAFAAPATDFMSLDCAGNMVLKGTLVQNATPLLAIHTSDGRNLVSYASRQAQPTVEDLGEGRMVNGLAHVSLDPTFAATIDKRTNYLVFITPDGDSRGLYVTEKTTLGFDVRENAGGRSNLTFDYRLVAKPYDTNAARLPSMASAMQGLRAMASMNAMSRPRITSSDVLRRMGRTSLLRRIDASLIRRLVSGLAN